MCKRSFYTKAFTHRGFYTQKRLHCKVLTHRNFYTQKLKLLHTHKLLVTKAFTQKLLRKSFHTKTLLEKETFSQKGFYTEVEAPKPDLGTKAKKTILRHF